MQRGLAINAVLALFNLILIPSRDGSRVFDAFVRFEYRDLWQKVGRFGWLALLVVLVFPMKLFRGPLREGVYSVLVLLGHGR